MHSISETIKPYSNINHINKIYIDDVKYDILHLSYEIEMSYNNFGNNIYQNSPFQDITLKIMLDHNVKLLKDIFYDSSKDIKTFSKESIRINKLKRINGEKIDSSFFNKLIFNNCRFYNEIYNCDDSTIIFEFKCDFVVKI